MPYQMNNYEVRFDMGMRHLNAGLHVGVRAPFWQDAVHEARCALGVSRTEHYFRAFVWKIMNGERIRMA